MKNLLIVMLMITGLFPAFSNNIDSIFVICDKWNNDTNKYGTDAYLKILKYAEQNLILYNNLENVLS